MFKLKCYMLHVLDSMRVWCWIYDAVWLCVYKLWMESGTSTQCIRMFIILSKHKWHLCIKMECRKINFYWKFACDVCWLLVAIWSILHPICFGRERTNTTETYATPQCIYYYADVMLNVNGYLTYFTLSLSVSLYLSLYILTLYCLRNSTSHTFITWM